MEGPVGPGGQSTIRADGAHGWAGRPGAACKRGQPQASRPQSMVSQLATRHGYTVWLLKTSDMIGPPGQQLRITSPPAS